MTTLAILADIHGNLTALQAVLDDLDRVQPDALLVAGDLINGGPQPAETLALLRARHAQMIRGNGDDYLIDYHRGAWSPQRMASLQWAAIRWAYRQTGPQAVEFLGSLPDQLSLQMNGSAPLRMLHGSLRRASEGLVPFSDPQTHAIFLRALEPAQARSPEEDLAQIEESVLICAHTHIPFAFRRHGKLALNPGSVGAPIHGDPLAQYTLLHWDGEQWQVEQRGVPYDLEALRRAYSASGYLEAVPGMARACLECSLRGENTAWFFMLHVDALSRRRSLPPAETYPDDLWLEACETFFASSPPVTL